MPKCATVQTKQKREKKKKILSKLFSFKPISYCLFILYPSLHSSSHAAAIFTNHACNHTYSIIHTWLSRLSIHTTRMKKKKKKGLAFIKWEFSLPFQVPHNPSLTRFLVNILYRANCNREVCSVSRKPRWTWLASSRSVWNLTSLLHGAPVSQSRLCSCEMGCSNPFQTRRSYTYYAQADIKHRANPGPWGRWRTCRWGQRRVPDRWSWRTGWRWWERWWV